MGFRTNVLWILLDRFSRATHACISAFFSEMSRQSVMRYWPDAGSFKSIFVYKGVAGDGGGGAGDMWEKAATLNK